jgi:hypothetical protein
VDLKTDPSFVPYLEKVTPLPYFGATNIGARPVKRSIGWVNELAKKYYLTASDLPFCQLTLIEGK